MADETTASGRVKVLAYWPERSGNRIGYVTAQFPAGLSLRRLAVLKDDAGNIRFASPRADGKPFIGFRDDTVRQRFTDAIVDAIRIDAPDLLKGN